MHNFLFIRLYLFLLFIYFFCRIGESPNLLELGWTVGLAAMACIHFKFKNSLDYDSITFDGLHIALRDLKRMIMNRKKLRDTDDDLQIINAITKKGQSDKVLSCGPKKISLCFLIGLFDLFFYRRHDAVYAGCLNWLTVVSPIL